MTCEEWPSTDNLNAWAISAVRLAQKQLKESNEKDSLMPRQDKESHGHRLSVHIPCAMHDQIRDEAHRLGRTPAWLVRRAWQIARKQIQALTAAPGVDDE